MSDIDPTLEDMAALIAVCNEEIRQLRSQQTILANRISTSLNAKQVAVKRFEAAAARVTL